MTKLRQVPFDHITNMSKSSLYKWDNVNMAIIYLYSTEPSLYHSLGFSKRLHTLQFWPSILGSLLKGKLQKEIDQAKKQVQEATEWKDPIEEKTCLMEDTFHNYKVLVEDKRAEKAGGAIPSNWYETPSGFR